MFFILPRYKKQSGSDFFLMAAEKVTQCLDCCLLLPQSTKDPGVEIGSNNIPLEKSEGMWVTFPFVLKTFCPSKSELEDDMKLIPSS